MATYVNDLRLKEIATGDESGTWGTSTNTNLELIADAFSYATKDCFASDADATETMADGVADEIRSLYLKVTSSATLTATRTLTLAPNTVSKTWIIENATTGGQSINISQGSGANVTIPNGDTKIIYTDGAGAGAAVTDAFANLKVTDPAQTNITSVGTLTGLTVNGNVSIDGGTIKLDGNYPTGTNNVALGNLALDDGSLSGGSNTAIGAASLSLNTSGIRNTAVGEGSLCSNTTGSYNEAFGRLALQANISGSCNVAIGQRALYVNTADDNTAVGSQALGANTTGTANTSLGFYSLKANTT